MSRCREYRRLFIWLFLSLPSFCRHCRSSASKDAGSICFYELVGGERTVDGRIANPVENVSFLLLGIGFLAAPRLFRRFRFCSFPFFVVEVKSIDKLGGNR